MANKLTWTALLSLVFVLSNTAFAAPTTEQRKAAKDIEDRIKAAAALFKAKKFQESADAIRQIEAEVEKLAADGNKDMLTLLKRPYGWLKSAHIQLELEGYSLPELKELGAAKPVKPDTPPKPTGVSFAKEVAPILVNRCGRCHVAKMQGEFSMATYENLMKGSKAGLVIFKNDAEGSVLIEQIAEGSMPPSGSGIPDGELATLKKWIAEGAKFDGDDPTTNLARIAPASEKPEVMVKVETSTGDEGSSFARDVAPVLVQNCGGCHVNAQQVRGGLNLTTFQGLLRGGDSEPPVKPGNPAESLLITKLKGTAGGQRMPLNRPALAPNVIAKIEKWISDGAKYDGGDPTTPIPEVAALARAKMSTHEQLSADRMDAAFGNWRLALADVKPYTSETDNFFLIGNVGEKTLAEYGEIAEGVAPKVAAIFKAPANKPLIKGRLTLYFFKIRYDYSEFGNMVEKRKLPANWRGHWRYTTVDAYGAMIPPRTEEEYSTEVMIGQQIAGAYVASLSKMPPRWFAEGCARVVASRLAADDPRVAGWDDEVPKVVASMNAPDDFLQGKLPPATADIANYSFAKYLMGDSKKFNLLLGALRKGEDFTKAFSVVYGGSPSQLTVAWAKKASRARPKRRTIGSK